MADQPRKQSGKQARDPHERQRQSVLKLLLAKVAEDTYPSTTQLDLIEELLTPEDLDDYREVLMQKVADETYPSTAMLQRLVALGG